MSDYPVQLEKVQAPPLRDETLARDRLLDWLGVKIHRRCVLVLAEAGYGKTTLLADFTRRTRVRISWYRLDRGDRDWLGFLAHLVAAFRIHQPDFGPATQSLIREASAANPSRDAVLDTFIRELGLLPSEPAALVLDDFHLVDDSQDARAIVRELLARAPERLSFVLIGRTVPSLPFARLRALGEVAELRTSDLRFAPEETERLFRETYALNLDASVVAELSRRTEGWIASLQLVRAAIRDRNQSEIRAFVRSLTGAEGDLYDYLAEEVVGELTAEMQQFLMRTSLLEIIEPVLGSVAAKTPPAQTRHAIDEGELLGLFSRTGPNRRDHVRAHPLVRDFLQARLLRAVGEESVIAIHRAIAAAAETIDWRIAGHHYLAAGDLGDARRVLAASIETILATGAYVAAEELVTALPEMERPDPNVLVVLSRLAQQRGQSALGHHLAESAYARHGDSGPVAVTTLSARLLAGDIDGAAAIARSLSEDADGVPARLGRASQLILATSISGDLGSARDFLEASIRLFRDSSSAHYLGVGLSNLGYLLKAEGEPTRALAAADEAIGVLEGSSAGGELVSAHLLRAWSLAHTGSLDGARNEAALATKVARGDQGLEVAYEVGEIEALYGSPDVARRCLMELGTELDGATDPGEQALVPLIHVQVALGRIDDAHSSVQQLRPHVLRSAVAFDARRQFAAAVVASVDNSADAPELARSARVLAEAQGAFLWVRPLRIFEAAGNAAGFNEAVWREGARDRATLSLASEAIASHLDWLDAGALQVVRDEAGLRPERWRGPIRRAVLGQTGPAQGSAADLLDEIGAIQDVAFLRRSARASKASISHRAGRALARRLAPIAQIEDLGRVTIRIQDRVIDGSMIRRKVLALVCLLLTKAKFAASREEVLEALWPDLEPGTALNSLNQTVYFLRRVFEPTYSEDTSPGYVGQDTETVWLDFELVHSRSRTCRDLIRGMGNPPDPEDVLHLAQEYHGRFALDFLYEDWASAYRDSLHAAFLRSVEASLRKDTTLGEYSRGIELAQLAMDAEPDAEEIQLALMRLYRLSGSLAAAAEQYSLYARTQRDLGIEPEPFETL